MNQYGCINDLSALIKAKKGDKQVFIADNNH